MKTQCRCPDDSGSCDYCLNVYYPNQELLKIAKAYRNLLRTMAHTDGEVASYHHINAVIAKAEGQE